MYTCPEDEFLAKHVLRTFGWKTNADIFDTLYSYIPRDLQDVNRLREIIIVLDDEVNKE